MKYFPAIWMIFLISVVSATTPHLGTLATDIQIPLCVEGRTVGAMSLKAGSEITIIKVDHDGVLVARGASTPFKVSRETLTYASLAAAEATPDPVPTRLPTFTPIASPTPKVIPPTISKNETITSNFNSLVGTWENIKGGYYQGGTKCTIEINSLNNIVVKQEFNTADGSKQMNSSNWRAREAGDKIIFEKSSNLNAHYASRSTFKQWYEIRLPFNLDKLEIISFHDNPDGSFSNTSFYKKVDK